MRVTIFHYYSQSGDILSWKSVYQQTGDNRFG